MISRFSQLILSIYQRRLPNRNISLNYFPYLAQQLILKKRTVNTTQLSGTNFSQYKINLFCITEYS